jgi:tetratricopeptide (TPR) repeat protein
LIATLTSGPAFGSSNVFQQAALAYKHGAYKRAAELFAAEAASQPSSGTLQNLGNAEWQSGASGDAIVAWERALWIDPFNNNARNNLNFGRKAAQLESPELRWFEVASTWFPADWWAWIAVISFWTMMYAIMLPAIYRNRRTALHQATAALALTLFFLTFPAQIGISTRSNLGFIVKPQAPLRLTPTAEGQVLARFAAGEPARLVRRKGQDVLLRTSHGLGWLRSDEFALIVR